MSLIKILGVLLTFNFSVQATRHFHPLFAWETTPLDPIDLARLVQDTNTSQYEHLFPFTGQNTPATPNRLSPGTCKVFPGDNDWPSPEAWDAFGKVLGGALIKTVPAAAVCYANTGLYDAQRCSQVQANFSNPYFQYASESL